MYESRLVSGLAIVLAGTAVLFVGLAVYNLVFLAVAFVFGASAYFVWYHASGRLARRVYRGVEHQAVADTGGGSGAGPREEWEAPGDGRRARAQSDGRVGSGARRGPAGERSGPAGAGSAPGDRRRSRRARQRGPTGPPGRPLTDGMTASEAYETLGIEPGADDATVRAAYREKVKEVHPDRPAGDEERFKRVNAAYERLGGD